MTIASRRRALMGAQKSGGGSGKSDMNGWTDGVAYTDLEIVQNSYVETNGQIKSYSGWNRTGYVPCDGATTIYFPELHIQQSATRKYNCFYTASKSFVSKFNLDSDSGQTITVPSNAAYFIISYYPTPLRNCINAGIVPHA